SGRSEVPNPSQSMRTTRRERARMRASCASSIPTQAALKLCSRRTVRPSPRTYTATRPGAVSTNDPVAGIGGGSGTVTRAIIDGAGDSNLSCARLLPWTTATPCGCYKTASKAPARPGRTLGRSIGSPRFQGQTHGQWTSSSQTCEWEPWEQPAAGFEARDRASRKHVCVTEGSGFDMRAQYTKYEYQVPMRDGTRLFTSVLVPKD